ncbi:hypothetical protein BGX26_001047 [Mortierella sp. AD094]|nr:hypothetical protein BGX26_001047 [Mortierella sp. AD094]
MALRHIISQKLPFSTQPQGCIGQAYIFGGEFQPRIPVDANPYVYDLQDESVKVIPQNESTPPTRVDLYSFDTESNIWEAVNSKSRDAPEPRSYHAMTSSNSDIYVFGGCPNKGRLDDLHSGEWIKALPSTNAPGPRSVHAIVPVSAEDEESDRLFIVFGEGNPSSIGHEGAGEFWGDVWTATLPKSLSQLNGGNLHVNYNQIKLAALQDNQDNLPSPRGWLQALPWNDKVVLIGGLSANNQRLSDLYLLSLD